METRSKCKNCEEEIRELIRVKVDLYGLTKEDIDYMLENGFARIKRKEGNDEER